jgi:hypothetical protein
LVLALAGCGGGRAARQEAKDQRIEARNERLEARKQSVAAESGAPSAQSAPSAPSAPPAPDALPEPAEGKSATVKQGGRQGVKTRVVFKTLERERLRPHNGLVCMLAGPLPKEFRYSDIGQITTTKGTYGGIDEVLYAMAEEGRRIGVDAIVELQSGRRHSSMVWRYSTPIGKGRLVKLSADSPPLECEKIDGKLN